jgi:hypothetical protein
MLSVEFMKGTVTEGEISERSLTRPAHELTTQSAGSGIAIINVLYILA